LHAAITGGPSSTHWDPPRQTATMLALLEGGADPNAPASGDVTPLHRAVRNRCSNAVRVLLDNGADPLRRNDSGSTALTLAQLTTGRGGSGSPAAKAEQAAILAMLTE
jgi:ankyrin repeat protein